MAEPSPGELEDGVESLPHVSVQQEEARTSSRPMKVKDVLKTVKDMRRAAELDKILSELDRDRDGTIDVQEMLGMLEGVIQSRRERRYMMYIIVALFLFSLCTIGAVVGLTYAVVNALKDTEVSGNTMYVKGSSTEVVRTGSAEFTVLDGVMVSRASLNATTENATAAAVGGAAPAQAVLQTASFLGTPQPLSSRIDIKTLFELKFLHIKGAGEVELGVVVNGVARVPQEGSVYGTVVRIISAAGTITLDGGTITFASEVADIFLEAGFRVSGNRRMLLGFYEVMGFFNTIKDLTVFNLPADQPKPELPAKNFLIKLKIYEPCSLPDAPSDRCLYAPGKELSPADATADSPQPPYPPTNWDFPPQFPNTPPLAPPSPPAKRRSAQEHVSQAVPARRHRYLRTVPHRRSLKSDAGFGAFDLAGVELLDSVRYMTHNETSIVWEGFTRVVYDYALYPKFQKIEVMGQGSDTVYQWQEDVVPPDSDNGGNPVFCRNYTLPPSLTAKAALSADSVLNFTYEGIDTANNKPARHFKLVIKQRFNSESTVTVDYWDSLSDKTPVAFAFQHPSVGLVRMEVAEFRALSSNSSEVSPEAFQQPSPDSCPTKAFLPRLASPFAVSGALVPDYNETYTVNSLDSMPEAERRMVMEGSVARAREWETLDHVNGTGEWPQWALDLYGGVQPGQSELRRQGRALMEDRVDCTSLSSSATVKAGPCSVNLKFFRGTPWPAIEGACGGEFPPLAIDGMLVGNLCEQKVQGCVSVGVGLSKENWLAKKLGMESIKIAELCIGYDFANKVFYIEGTFTVWALVAKAELTFAIKFSSCCIWLEEVKVEAFVGLDVGFFDVWTSIGSAVLVTETFWKGSKSELGAWKNPNVINLRKTVDVGVGWYGDWKPTVWCGRDFLDYKDRAKRDYTLINKFVGAPMNAFEVRYEEDGFRSDDTMLNGLKIRCQGDKEFKMVEEGLYGDWYGSPKPVYSVVNNVKYGGNSCQAQWAYFTGARIRIEGDQGPWDDTAANAIEFKCNNNVVAHTVDGVFGEWPNDFTSCDYGQFICGVQVRFEDYAGAFVDDTALNGLRIYCCSTWW